MCINPLFRVEDKLNNKVNIYSYKSYRHKFKNIIKKLSEDKLDYEDSTIKVNCIPCGKCVECQKRKASDWSVRCSYEAKAHLKNCFITLTFDDKKIDRENQNKFLCKRDIQLFIKKLRSYVERNIDKNLKLRYYLCGEYGSRNLRPHYHIVLFGYDFSDKKLRSVGRSKSGFPIYESDVLNDLWHYGRATIQKLVPKTCLYTAGYCLKKHSKKIRKFEESLDILANEEYINYHNQILEDYFVGVDKDIKSEVYNIIIDNIDSVLKEFRTTYQKSFQLMSRGKGLGKDVFLSSYFTLLNNGCIVIDGRKYPIPRYFRRLVEYTSVYEEFINNCKKLDKELYFDLDYLLKREKSLLKNMISKLE